MNINANSRGWDFGMILGKEHFTMTLTAHGVQSPNKISPGNWLFWRVLMPNMKTEPSTKMRQHGLLVSV
jgi:hypothetical protein